MWALKLNVLKSFIKCFNNLLALVKIKVLFLKNRDNIKLALSRTFEYQKKVAKYSTDLIRDWSYIYYPAPLLSLLKQPKLITCKAFYFLLIFTGDPLMFSLSTKTFDLLPHSVAGLWWGFSLRNIHRH